MTPSYQHCQVAPLYLLLVAIGTVEAALAWPAWSANSVIAVALLAAAAITLAAAVAFKHLTVRDEGDCLGVRFGPLPLFHLRIRYSDITGVEAGRSNVLDGWGIHYMPGRGWTWNLWGWSCVVIHRGRRTLRIGTDDAAGLLAFLKSRTTPSGS